MGVLKSVLYGVCVTAVCLCFSAPAMFANSIQSRMALVIGNDRYHHLSDLKNPQYDAAAISQTLSNLGFTVYLAHNLNTDQMNRAVEYFNDKATDAELALFHYAGHGARLEDVNYLFGVDFDPTLPFTAEQALSLDELQVKMNRDLRVNVFLIDACQDDPFLEPLNGTINQFHGQLTPTSPPIGSILTYASMPGSAAYDGTFGHSLFTGALLDNLQQPDVDIEIMLRDVRKDVILNSGSQQIPQTVSALTSKIQLNPKTNLQKNPMNRSLILSLSENGVSHKPVLADLSKGVEITARPPAKKDGRAQLRNALCKLLKDPLPTQCS